ncbi:hypothetical protein [Thiopseudomonas alkaliphila]|uniref:hypothetical protein n=1 Tax=Thiopseudomonas alkaliphila TaxID=1697053 RepID=UPI00257580E3|nr:hypothetical protein [Thiopseudomonas alkaliphila]MDM1717332.1 hypothetical protein [Thiopseudomonas alkaliphila]
MKTFFVKLHIQAGEYEKNCSHLVIAGTEEEAEKLAIRNEAHNDELITKHGFTFEIDGSFAYAANEIFEITDEKEIEVLKKYLT